MQYHYNTGEDKQVITICETINILIKCSNFGESMKMDRKLFCYHDFWIYEEE